ncbi:MAG: cupredoxin domain-containing protein, partial [Nitrosopumilaceae archaeon]
MNSSKPFYLLGVSVLVVILGACLSSAFAATEQVTITQGSGAGQSCVTTANCFDPKNIQIAVGDTVTWTNADNVGHAATSGNPNDTQTGTIFYSGLIPAGGTYSFTFQNAGTYPYFDQSYPWMTGQVIVGGSSSTQTSVQPQPTPQQSSAQESISVSTDKSSYNYGDSIVISGYVSPVIPNQMITYQLQLPTGDKSATSQVNPNADGSYSISTSFANPNLSSGIYAVIVTYAGIQNQATFSYVGSQAQAPTIPSTTSSIPSTTTPSIQYNIPYWVKNDAKWWSEGQISDGEFVKAVQYLVDNGILTPNQAMNEINQLQDQNQ